MRRTELAKMKAYLDLVNAALLELDTATGTIGPSLKALNLAASTSTGGSAGKFPGRVGDSPLVGCGGYADNLTGAVSATGAGEAIMKVVLSKAACDLLACGADPQAAAEKAVALLRERTQGRGGLLIVDRKARVGAAFSTARMAYAFRTSNSDAVIRV